MAIDIGFWGAFIGGLLSFASPCVLPLVPPYLCFLAGLSLDQLSGNEETPNGGQQIFFSSLAFVSGFTTVFVTLGASASFIGQLVADNLDTLSMIAGIVIIIMGLHFLGIFKIPFLYREARFDMQTKPAGLIGAYVVGLAFAFGWTPCVGPALTAILLIAGSEDSSWRGAALLAAYSLGIGIPFLLAALFANPFMRFMRRFSRHLGKVEKAMGALLVITGILFITGSMNEIAYFILEFAPALGKNG